MNKVLLSEEDRERIVASVFDKFRQDRFCQKLYKDLLAEHNPVEVEKKFRDFIEEHNMSPEDIRNLIVFFKTEGLLKEHVKREGLHNVWIKLRNEYAPGLFIEN